MCVIFTSDGSRVRVRGTKIFVAPDVHGRQLTVYENLVGLPGRRPAAEHAMCARRASKRAPPKNAMILPVPCGRVDLLDLSKHTGVFKSLDSAFPRSVLDDLMSKSKSLNGKSFGVSRLVVEEVGAYLVSIAPRLEDLHKIDPQHFTVVPGVAALLEKHYVGFSFIVCRFKDGVSEGSPIGYIHERLPNGCLFVPTRHSHGGEEETPDQADWDHDIYTANTVALGSIGTGKAFDMGGTPAEKLVAMRNYGDQVGDNATLKVDRIIPGTRPQDALLKTGLHNVGAQLIPCEEVLRRRRVNQRDGKQLPNDDIVLSVISGVLEELAVPAGDVERTAAVEDLVRYWIMQVENASDRFAPCTVC